MATNETPLPYPHWMMREMHEQPATLQATLDQWVNANSFREDAVEPVRAWLRKAGKEILLVASGSSRHAGLLAELLVEDLSGVAVDVEYASEYLYRSEKALKDAAVLVVSQSGETIDTLHALRKAKGFGHTTLAITNVPGSSMAKDAEFSMPTAAGRERAVPATKSFTAQLLNLYVLALLAAQVRDALSADDLQTKLDELGGLADLVKRQLPRWESSVSAVAKELKDARSFLFVGRGVHYAIAREGALKLKESSYLHAEGIPSGELKHGPNALLSKETPLVMLATVDRSDAESAERYEKVLQLMRDMRAQGATILAVANTGDTAVAELADHVFNVDEASEPLLAISEVIPLQLFAYFMAVGNGIDVDHPRNLNKAVLAE